MTVHKAKLVYLPVLLGEVLNGRSNGRKFHAISPFMPTPIADRYRCLASYDRHFSLFMLFFGAWGQGPVTTHQILDHCASIYLRSAAEQTNYDDEHWTKTASARRSRACLPCA